MAEREEGNKREGVLKKSFYKRAGSVEGFRIELNEQDVFSMRIAGSEITLFIKPEPSVGEVMEAPETASGEPTVEAANDALPTRCRTRIATLAGDWPSRFRAALCPPAPQRHQDQLRRC